MTADAVAAAPSRPVPHVAREGLGLLKRYAGDVAVTAAVGWWATILVRGAGGRDPHVLSSAVVVLLAALLLVRPWRVLSLPALLLGNGVGVAAFLVTLTSPTGWAGADDAASYAYTGQLALVCLAWADRGSRRLVLFGTLVLAGGLQFAQGWLPWWGSEDPTTLFLGTFYWHNQTGVFLVAGALLAFTVVAAGQRPLSTLAWFVGPLCAAGVMFTTSRGSEIVLVLGVLGLFAVTLLARGLPRGWLRLAGVVLIGTATSFLLAGPPFFPGRASPLDGTAARSNSLGANSFHRVDDWRRAVDVFRHWPFTGAGFHSFSSAVSQVTETGDGVSTAFAHNGFLQAFADGGLLLGLVLTLAVGALLLRGARDLPAALRSGSLLQAGAFVTFVVLLMHSGIDFDWSYPALLSLTAMVGVLTVPVAAAATDARATRIPGIARTVTAVLGVLLLCLAVVGAWHGGLDLNASVTGG